jgi:hypothetical protein
MAIASGSVLKSDDQWEIGRKTYTTQELFRVEGFRLIRLGWDLPEYHLMIIPGQLKRWALVWMLQSSLSLSLSLLV